MRSGEPLGRNNGAVSLDCTNQSFEHYCQFFALFENFARPGHATYEDLHRCFLREMDRYAGLITHCRTRCEAIEANRNGKAAAFLSVEGAELLDCSLLKLEQAASDGVISINLTWNHANLISGSCREESERGLSDLGRQFVRRMDELDILVDVSHLSDAGFWDVAEMTEKPFIASHSNARTVHDHARNLTNDQITAIIGHNGIIGLNFFRDFIGLGCNLDAIRAHLDHILDLGGEKCVALGGDWDGCFTIDELPRITALTDLYDHLMKKGYDRSFLNDFYFNNLMRVVRES